MWAVISSGAHSVIGVSSTPGWKSTINRYFVMVVPLVRGRPPGRRSHPGYGAGDGFSTSPSGQPVGHLRGRGYDLGAEVERVEVAEGHDADRGLEPLHTEHRRRDAVRPGLDLAGRL